MIKPIRILIVDDGPINLILVTNLLNKEGFQLSTAENGQLAINKLQEERFDLILMDLEMPEVDGIMATKIIRTQLGITIPIIAVSASERVSSQQECTDAGMNGFLSKPFMPEELIEIIQAHLPVAPAIAVPETISSTSVPGSLVDLALLKQNAFGDQAFEQQMIRLMITETNHRIPELKALFESKDLTGIRKLVHMMKPAIEHVAHAPIRKLLPELQEETSTPEVFLQKTLFFIEQLELLLEELKTIQ